ncbi:MAG: hypothetical protein ABFS37_04280 [Acidobacteriota bacterium]
MQCTNRFTIGITLGLSMIMLVLAAPGWSLDPDTSRSTAVRLTQGEFEEMTQTMGKAYGSPLVVPAAAFRSDGLNPDQLHYAVGLGILQGQDVENAYAVAPIYIPEGATISAVQASVFDGFNGPGACDGVGYEDVAVWLYRVSNSTSEALQMAFFTTTGVSGDIQHILETSVDYPTVAYPEYAYYAVARLCHSAHAFHTLQIFYSMD